MTNFEWKTRTPARENGYVVLAAAVVAIVYAVLIASKVADERLRLGAGAMLVLWVAFSIYRSRPRSITLVGGTLVFNNLGPVSLANLRQVRIRRLLGLEKTLEITSGSASRSIALHGVPHAIQLQLVQALQERVAGHTVA